MIPIDTWIELGALLMLGRNTKSARLCDSDGVVLAWKGADEPENCEEELRTEAGCFPIVYPWDLLRMNEEVVALMDETVLLGEVSPKATVSGSVRLAPGARILPGSVIEGPVVIGTGTQIGPNAFIRGATSIGANCYIGHGAEVKNSIIYPNTYISRQCYVGDSIIGCPRHARSWNYDREPPPRRQEPHFHGSRQGNRYREKQTRCDHR